MASEIEQWPVVTHQEVQDFMTRCMEAAGACTAHARILAESVSTSDFRGHYSHGLNRLEKYANEVKKGITCGEGEPTILNETVATAWVSGNNLLGHVVGKFSMELAIKKAKDAGIGWVVAKDSNHFGIAGWYAMMASKHGLLGMAYTSTSPFVVPTRSKTPAMGTNPICVAAPAQQEGQEFVLDMATSTVAQGKLEYAKRRGEPIPPGWGCDDQGKVTTDPEVALATGGLMPLGGPEELSGYKGYGLGMMVEVFCSILGGATYGLDTPKWTQCEQPFGYAQCFVAVDPAKFAPGFQSRMDDMMDMFRGLDVSEGGSEVLIPGDPERQHMALCGRRGGIPYHSNQIHNVNELADRLRIPRIKIL